MKQENSALLSKLASVDVFDYLQGTVISELDIAELNGLSISISRLILCILSEIEIENSVYRDSTIRLEAFIDLYREEQSEGFILTSNNLILIFKDIVNQGNVAFNELQGILQNFNRTHNSLGIEQQVNIIYETYKELSRAEKKKGVEKINIFRKIQNLDTCSSSAMKELTIIDGLNYILSR